MHETNDLFIGFDLGTSGIKALLCDSRGNVHEKSTRTVEIIRNGDDHYEIDPIRYVESLIDVIAELSRTAGPNAHRIRGIATCAASGNAVLLDADHRPLGNAISWLDTRTRGREADLWPGLDPQTVYRSGGWPWKGVFPLAHYAWTRDNRPELWKKASSFTMNDTFVYSELCGRLAIDPSKATTSFIYDQERHTWNGALLDFLGISERGLPEIVPSGTAIGALLPNVAERTNLSPDTRVVAGSFDHPAAARSTGVFDPGDLLISTGTSWVAFAPVASRDTALSFGGLIDPFLESEPGGSWGSMLSLTAVSRMVQDVLTRLLGDRSDLWAAFDATASKSSAGAGGLLVNPWESSLDEVIGQVANHPVPDATRSLMEGCTYLLRNRIESIEDATGTRFKRVVMVGGATNSPIWPRILASVLGRQIVIPESGHHAGALGAAILAGVGTGVFGDVRSGYEQMHSSERTILPNEDEIAIYDEAYPRYCRAFGMEFRNP